MLELGILKNFDSGTYKAGVQLAGSPTTYFDDISVARNIPAAAMVVGNYVIVAIPGGNPRDACVIATWPGGSPGGGAGSFLDLSDTPSSYSGQALKLVRVTSDMAALEFKDIAQTLASVMKAWIHLDWFLGGSGWTDSVTGSGYILRGPYYQNVYTGTTIGSRASTKTTVDWVVVTSQEWVALMPAASTMFTNSTMWLGFLTTYNNPSDIEKHYAFKIINGSIYASCADGSNQTIEDTGVALVPGVTPVLMLRPYFSGGVMTKVEYYIDGTLKKTLTTNLPGVSTLQFGQTIINTEAANKKLSLYPFDIFVY